MQKIKRYSDLCTSEQTRGAVVDMPGISPS